MDLENDLPVREEAAREANARLAEMIKELPVVEATAFLGPPVSWWYEEHRNAAHGEGGLDVTHTARLIDVKEIEK